MLSKELWLILVGLVLGTWFLVDEKRSTGEKIGVIVGLVALYFGYRYLFKGPSFTELIAPLIKHIEQ